MSGTDDDMKEHEWPDERVDAADVRGWIAHALPRRQHVSGPLEVYQAKEWGVTARFSVAPATGEPAREVVFKANQLPLFRDAPYVESLLSRHCPGAVPEVLAWEWLGDGTWMLYTAFSGVSAAATQDMAPLLGMARILAAIQTRIAALPQAELSALPRVPLRDFPSMFEAVLADVRARYLTFWHGEGAELAAQFSLPEDIDDLMESFRDWVGRWVYELEAGDWPLSLDHVDLQADNAVLQPNGDILIYDWEEANLSCPFFSLDRLLDDARELSGENGERQLRTAYLDALPWGTRAARERALDLALCLSPLKHAHEAMRIADTLGWSEGAPHICAWAIARALPRWQVITTMLPDTDGQ